MMSEWMRWFALIALMAVQMPSRDASLSAALAELDKGHVLESIQQFKQIVRSDPTNGPAYFYLSTLYTELKEFAFAERYLQRAMELSPNQGEHYYQLGLIRFRRQQWRPALESFKKALEIGFKRNPAPVWRSIGDVQLELFDRDSALQAYTEALRNQPGDSRTLLALGRFYLDRGEPDRAAEHLRAALKTDPSLRAAHPLLGRAYQQSGDLQSAVTLLREAVDTDPADQDSRYTLGRTLLAIGRADEGRAELDKYERIRQQVAGADSNYKSALSSIAEGKLSEAEESLREAVRLAPAYGPALQSLGALLLDRGSPEKALGFLERSVQVNPLNAATWGSLGNAYFKTGRLNEALEAAKRAVALNDDDPQYQRLLREIEGRVRR
jgi:tetratricopeptide (TPR) repeat protein